MKRFALMLLLVCVLVGLVGAQAQSVSYTVKLGGDEEIYQGHGVDYGFARYVGNDGVYTIVEEAYDEYDNLWGRLKSGAGWVMLEEAQGIIYTYNDVPYTTSLKADVEIFEGPNFGYLRDVGADGVYTIVEEAYDEYDNLWGRLKSGAGWVLLEESHFVNSYKVEPYTISLKADDVICEKPNRGYLRDVGADGVYTIVEEGYDEAGNLWGRLKSGAGWVLISRNEMEYEYSEYQVALDAWVPVYDSPSEMDAACIGIIGEDGVFTIIDEVQDELGNVWGELKSGAGWVNLNYVRFMGKPPITAYFADVIDSIDAEWCDVVVDNSEYIVRIAFRANERLNNVKFTTLQYGDTYEVEEVHHRIHWLEEDAYFVAGVVFYGDMTTYGISFVDEAGEGRYYAVSISGMNGALVMNEYIP